MPAKLSPAVCTAAFPVHSAGLEVPTQQVISPSAVLTTPDLASAAEAWLLIQGRTRKHSVKSEVKEWKAAQSKRAVVGSVYLVMILILYASNCLRWFGAALCCAPAGSSHPCLNKINHSTRHHLVCVSVMKLKRTEQLTKTASWIKNTFVQMIVPRRHHLHLQSMFFKTLPHVLSILDWTCEECVATGRGRSGDCAKICPSSTQAGCQNNRAVV